MGRVPGPRPPGLAPPGWPIGWRARAASSSLHLASSAWFRVAHASVCVRAAAAGLGRAPQPRVRLLERCQRWGAAVRGPPASLPRRSLNSPALGLLVHSYLPVCSEGHTVLHAQGLLSSALGVEMLLLDFNSEVRLGPLLSYKLKLPDVCLLGSASTGDSGLTTGCC